VNIDGTSSVPSVGQCIRLLRQSQIKVNLNGEFNSLAVKPRLEKILACGRVSFRLAYIPVNGVQGLDLIFTTVFLEISVQVMLPLLSIDTLSAKRFDVVADVREEYVQASNCSL